MEELGRDSGDDGKRLDVGDHDGAGPDNRTLAHGHAWKDDGRTALKAAGRAGSACALIDDRSLRRA